MEEGVAAGASTAAAIDGNCDDVGLFRLACSMTHKCLEQASELGQAITNLGIEESSVS